MSADFWLGVIVGLTVAGVPFLLLLLSLREIYALGAQRRRQLKELREITRALQKMPRA